jgi:hypothetical protein
MPKEAATIVVVMLLLAAMVSSYGIGYWFSVEQVFTSEFHAQAIPSDRWGGEPAVPFFWPAHQIDRRLRPNLWDESPYVVRARLNWRRFYEEHGIKPP